jgi:hypothetical protein
MFPYLPQVKLATQIVAGLGVSKIVNDIIKNNVAITTTVQAVTVKAGGFVIGSMLWEQSSNHIERMANDVATWFENKNDKDKDTEK